MSESDKTRQKLMESMRKTKSGAADKAQSNTTAEKTEPQKAQPVETGNKSSRAVKKPSKPKSENTGTVDAYQSRKRRVWPD